MRNKKKISLLSYSFFVERTLDFCPIIVGKICSVYGILGWLKIISFTDNLNNIMGYQPWFVYFFSKWRSFYLEDWKKYRDDFRFIVKFKGIFDRDQASLLNNHKIFVDVMQFPNLRNGEYYWKDIIEFLVIGMCGYNFGTVIDLIETGSNDVLVVKSKEQDNIFNKTYLIPCIQTVIKDINFLDHIINVDWNPKF